MKRVIAITIAIMFMMPPNHSLCSGTRQAHIELRKACHVPELGDWFMEVRTIKYPTFIYVHQYKEKGREVKRKP